MLCRRHLNEVLPRDVAAASLLLGKHDILVAAANQSIVKCIGFILNCLVPLFPSCFKMLSVGLSKYSCNKRPNIIDTFVVP